MADLPFDFGEFSLRSLGITINISHALGRLYPVVGATLFTGDAAAARAAIVKELADPATTSDEWFVLLGYASCQLHELRHYHDHLATPFGARMMADHVLAARCIVPAVWAMREEPALGLPLQQWEALSPRLASAYRARTKSGEFSERPPETTRRMTEAVSNILARVQQQYGSSARFPDIRLTSRHLLEASALIVQTDLIEASFGRDAAVEFAKHLKGLDHDVYTRVFTMFNHMAGQLRPGEFFSPLVMNAIVFFSLCGSGSPEDGWFHPCDRLMGVLGYLQASRDWPTDDNVLDVLDHVAAKVLKVKTWRESLTASVEMQNKLSEGLPRLNPGGAAKLLDGGLVEAYRAFAKAHAFMVGTILEDPIRYLDPGRYRENMDGWVGAPIFIGGSRTAVSGEEAIVDFLKKNGWSIVWAHGDGTVGPDRALGIGLMASPKLSRGEPVLPEPKARHLSLCTWMVYLLWSTDMLNAIQREVGARQLKLANEAWDVLLL